MADNSVIRPQKKTIRPKIDKTLRQQSIKTLGD